MVEAVAVKEPVVAAAATVTLAGTVKLALLPLRAMVAPPVGAGPLNAKEHALVPGPVKAAGVHVRLVTVTGAFSVIVTLALPPLAAAVTAAVESLAIVPAVAENVAVVAPALAVIEDGAVSHGLPEERITERPPDGAGALRVTVQVLLVADVRDVGVQASAVTVASGARLKEAVCELPLNATVM